MKKFIKESFKALGFFGAGLFISQIITNGFNDVFIGGLVCCGLLLVSVLFMD